MIRESLCMWFIYLLLKLFGQEIFAVSAVCSLPDPAPRVLTEYLQEVQHRIKMASPAEVGRALVGLRDAGKVREMGDRYEVTREGLNMVWGER